MFIARIHIKNYRCFRDSTVEFSPGLNVIIGENNSGKTTLLKALSLVFDRRGRPRVHDFHCLVDALEHPPKIEIAVILRSSSHDTEADRALVAAWLTKLDSPWEAQLTYCFFLPEQHLKEFQEALGGTADRIKYFEVVEEFLPKFVSRIYAGNQNTLITADGESLNKFDCQFLDALRDVESEMFAGSTPLFRAMLEEALDLEKGTSERRALRSSFRGESKKLREVLVNRLDTERLFELVKETGAADGGSPQLHGGIEEADLIAALRLFIDKEQFVFPATHQGLGYNNLLYISLLLASMRFRSSEKRYGQNAVIFPMLLIEEPEAHLHPALQHKLMSHIVSRVESEPRHNRQIFVTTHSTHITSASRLDPIVCLSSKADGSVGVSYPARLFPTTSEGQESRRYVERYLDATKSAMLFAKATVFVEGITELLTIPAFAAALKRPFDRHHVAVVRVDGVTFKHFLPLFGGGVSPEMKEFALDRRVACIVDADPGRKEKAVLKPRWKSCFPFQLDRDQAKFDYRSTSGTLGNLKTLQVACDNIAIFHGEKTFEYDLALVNHTRAELVTGVVKYEAALCELVASPAVLPDVLEGILNDDELLGLAAVASPKESQRHRFAALYLRAAEDCKGEHAFALEHAIRSASQPKAEAAGSTEGAEPVATETTTQPIVCPEYISKAIVWVTSLLVEPGARR